MARYGCATYYHVTGVSAATGTITIGWRNVHARDLFVSDVEIAGPANARWFHDVGRAAFRSIDLDAGIPASVSNHSHHRPQEPFPPLARLRNKRRRFLHRLRAN